MTEQNLDEIAEIIETLDNLIAASSIPGMPFDLAFKGLSGSIPGVRARLMSAYLSMGGEDRWGDDD